MKFRLPAGSAARIITPRRAALALASVCVCAYAFCCVLVFNSTPAGSKTDAAGSQAYIEAGVDVSAHAERESRRLRIDAARGDGAALTRTHTLTQTQTEAADGKETKDEAAEHAEIRATLGRGTWNMLHRMAAQYPREPTASDVERVTTFFRAFSHMYPCEECASHFRSMLADTPIDTRSNLDLSIWLCGLHNRVNARLGKPAFPCTREGLKVYGSCGCFEEPAEGKPNATAAESAKGLAGEGAVAA